MFDKICEDCPHKIDIAVNGQSLLDHLVPEFIRYSAHSSAKIRIHCLSCLHALNGLQVPALSANIDSYIAALFARATDSTSDIRRAVCSALSLIFNMRPDKLMPELKNVVDYISYCTKDQDEVVALEACEFWLSFLESEDMRPHVRPFIGQIAPLLLTGMVYSEYDLVTLDVDDEDEAVPDRESDIKPRAYGGKSHTHESNDPSGANKAGGQSREAAERALEEDSDDEYDYDDDDDEFGSEWNIRKCSAAAMDVMSVAFGNELLEVLLPHLKERLFSQEWEQRESGVLALGAIAEGESG